MKANDLNVKIFADGADLESIRGLLENPLIQGFTTNPTLMRAAGVADYEVFAKEVLSVVTDRPVSFEVFSDDFAAMAAQARHLSTWADNVYVKVPVTDTKGRPTEPVLRELSAEGVQLNVTALTMVTQVEWVTDCLRDGKPSVVSVFAGRIADSGVDPVPIMRDALAITREVPGVELLWASPRELLNIVQADQIGCDIITVTHDLLKKLPTLGKDLEQFSLETVQMFHRDAQHAGYTLDLGPE